MAEYLPLLERAVAGLSDSNPETRRAIYERARSALLGQLRSMEPPVPEDDIARESEALDEAISRLEAAMETQRPVAEPLGTKQAPSRDLRAPTIAPARGAGPSRPPAATPAPGTAMPPSRERPVLPTRPPAPTPPSAPAATPRAPSSSESPEKTAGVPPRPLRSARPLNTAPRVGIEPRVAALASEPPVGQPEVPTLRPVDRPPVASSVPPLRLSEPSPPVVVSDGPPVPPGDAAEASKPNASSHTPEEPAAINDAPRRRAPALYVAAAIGALLVAGVAVEAWRLRDRPEQVTASQPAAAEPTGKVVDRAAGESPPGPTPQETPSGTAGAQVPVTATAPAADRSGAAPSSAPVVAAPAMAPGASEQTSSPAIGVAERAALLLDAPQEQQKIRTYVGSVVWKTQNVSAGQAQPLSEAIVAEVDIPDAKMTMSMVMKRNTEPQFPASHTIEFRFTTQPGSDLGAVKQIGVPDLRLDDNSPVGEPLTGLPVAITDNYFLVGLSRGEAEGANIKMLQKRNWIDVPLVLASGKAGKITFEKGAPGERIIDEALRSWQSGG